LHGAKFENSEQLSEFGRLSFLNKILAINSGTNCKLKLL
jgi:hypothetical protein